MTIDKLIFSRNTAVSLAGNLFIDVPVILQYDDTPMIECVSLVALRNPDNERAISIPIYHSDGTYLGKYKDSRFHPTEEGENAGVSVRYPQSMAVCEMNGETLFEIKRISAAAINIVSEIYTPDGHFIKCNHGTGALYGTKDNNLIIGSVTMSRCQFMSCYIGIHMKSDGSVGIGCGRP